MEKKENIGYKPAQYSYGSYPTSTPQRMYVLAKIFSCTVRDYRLARVLELGCAQGHNLIDLAVKYPQAHFVGVDSAQEQIEVGNKIITDLGLKNISLINVQIHDIDDKLGFFDYIIAHDLFSWVLPETREDIFKVLQQRLTLEGVAYINYNTLPGCKSRQVMRYMLQGYTSKFPEPIQKMEQTNQMLRLLMGKFNAQYLACSQDNSLNSSMLKNHSQTMFAEMQAILQMREEKLQMEYLSTINDPIYVGEFIEQAQKNGLAYLSDANIYNNHFRDVIPFSKQDFEQKLFVNSYAELLQLSDFLLNRQHRETILCRASQHIDRNVEPGVFKGFYLRAFGNIAVVMPEAKINHGGNLGRVSDNVQHVNSSINSNSIPGVNQGNGQGSNQGNGQRSNQGVNSADNVGSNQDINSEEAMLKTCFNAVITKLNQLGGGTISYDDLLNLALEVGSEKQQLNKIAKQSSTRGDKKGRLAAKAHGKKLQNTTKLIQQWFDNLLLRIYHDGYIEIMAEASSYATALTEKPLAATITRYYAANFDFIINHRHETVKINNAIEKFVLHRLDGTKSIAAIGAELLELAKQNGIVFPPGSIAVLDEANVQQYCRKVVEKFVITASLLQHG